MRYKTAKEMIVDGEECVGRLESQIRIACAERDACAAGPWRTDVENAPKYEWLAVWYAEHPTDWFKARCGAFGWEDPLYKPTRTPDAFAIPNPPRVTT